MGPKRGNTRVEQAAVIADELGPRPLTRALTLELPRA